MFSALRFLTGVASVSSSVTMLILCKFRNYRVERSCCYTSVNMDSWWRHLMKTFSALLDLCAGNSPVSFDVFVDLRLMKPLRKQWRLWWFETPEPSLWRHSNDFSLSYNNNLWRIYRLTHWGLGQNNRHLADDIFKCLFLNDNVWISIKISLKFVPKGPRNNILTLAHIMAWRLIGANPLSEPTMVRSPTHICVTWPQYPNYILVRCRRRSLNREILICWSSDFPVGHQLMIYLNMSGCTNRSSTLYIDTVLHVTHKK